jgi:hypothetical protein
MKGTAAHARYAQHAAQFGDRLGVLIHPDVESA